MPTVLIEYTHPIYTIKVHCYLVWQLSIVSVGIMIGCVFRIIVFCTWRYIQNQAYLLDMCFCGCAWPDELLWCLVSCVSFSCLVLTPTMHISICMTLSLTNTPWISHDANRKCVTPRKSFFRLLKRSPHVQHTAYSSIFQCVTNSVNWIHYKCFVCFCIIKLPCSLIYSAINVFLQHWRPNKCIINSSPASFHLPIHSQSWKQ